MMKLRIASPAAILVDTEAVSIRAEDSSGAFGMLKGHANFLTALTISIVSWRMPDGRVGFCAVRNGILTVSKGQEVAIATREAHVGDDLAVLEHEVLSHYRDRDDSERSERVTSARIRMRAIRHMVEALQDGGREMVL
ncbi:F0F1 ATP synthase subunit epsilon [Tardiphaga sp.]|uniref:F0F1 ATP synthase subunit epsilon n=1 Tax=Tardiphaga sp. TaxID=1926292 RepID=UPI00352B1DE9